MQFLKPSTHSIQPFQSGENSLGSFRNSFQGNYREDAWDVKRNYNRVLTRFSCRAKQRMDEEVVIGSQNNIECSVPQGSNISQSGITQSWQGNKPDKISKASPQKKQNKKNGGSSLSSSKPTATSTAKTATGRIKSQEHNQTKEPQKNCSLPKQGGSQSAGTVSNQSQKNALPHLPASAANGEVGPDLHTASIKLPNDQELPLADIVKKVSKDKKPTRQILMLHQQMYQESQKLTDTDSNMTNNYSNFNAASNQTGYYTMAQASYTRTFSDQSRVNTCSGSYDTLNGYNSFQNNKVYSQKSSNYETSHMHRSSPNTVMIHGYERQSAAGNEMQTFQPAKSSLSFYSTPMLSSYSRNDIVEIGTPVELFVSNLDYNISPGEWKNILQTTFSPHVKVVSVNVRLQPDNTSLGTVRVATIDDARLAISQFHRKKIGYKRIHVTLKSDDSQKTASSIRWGKAGQLFG